MLKENASDVTITILVLIPELHVLICENLNEIYCFHCLFFFFPSEVKSIQK